MSCEAVAARTPLPFRVGPRTLARVHRRLVRVTMPLEQAIAGAELTLPGLPPRADGYYLRAVPEVQASRLGQASGMRAFVRQSYPRHYADLGLGWDAYLATFSAKTRSSLKRKTRKLAEHCGGSLDLRAYRTPAEIADFYCEARAVSALTYQERLLDAGLPDALDEMQALAERDQVRGFLLFAHGRAIAYLYAPGAGHALRYEHLGYDPAFADWSPGSVLQLEAMRTLMGEGRFGWFDFTEGDGQHKRTFATGSIPSVDLLLLRPTVANLAAGAALTGLDRAVSFAKRIARR
jgi:CelD/BcsL family acetyltransferase involved in cellulose biosynthesis